MLGSRISATHTHDSHVVAPQPKWMPSSETKKHIGPHTVVYYEAVETPLPNHKMVVLDLEYELIQMPQRQPPSRACTVLEGRQDLVGACGALMAWTTWA